MDIFREFIIAFNPQQNGFFFMWILAGIALVAVLIMLERLLRINRYTNIDASRFIERLLGLVREEKLSDAAALCRSGNTRALPAVLGAGVQRAIDVPAMAATAMEEESLHVLPRLERRLNLIVTFGNLATLLGLMGTIYGLILAFAAVAQPDVSPVEKSSMLAIGISAAMNTTLLGLVIAVPCVLVYSLFRSRIDEAVAEIDRYAVALMKVLVPESGVKKSYRVSDRRIREEVDTEPNIVPFMNLMVVLIPLLLSSSEFVKLGMIELKLPESATDGGDGGGNEEKKNAKVDLGIVITENGFNLFHYFKKDSTVGDRAEIPKVDGKYDFQTLNRNVAEVKRKALFEIIRQAKTDLPEDTELWKLSYLYKKNNLSSIPSFPDHESVKIVADDKIHYQTVVSVMDAARGVSTPNGNVTLFPNVSIAGGIVQ